VGLRWRCQRSAQRFRRAPFPFLIAVLFVVAILTGHKRQDSMAKAPPKPARRPARIKSVEAAREYIMVQGEVVNCANLLHDAFYDLFRIAMALERRDGFAAMIRFQDHALAIWHTIQSDSVQREMAMTAISTVPTNLKLEPALQRLRWANRTATTLTTYRNILAHNSIIFAATKVDPNPEWVAIIGGRGSRPSAQQRISLMRGIAPWRRLAGDLLRLYAYVDSINQQIQRLFAIADNPNDPTVRARVSISWPRRPRLRSLSRAREIDSQLHQAKPATTRKRLRRPSRPSPRA
jgi:hypothetical protein